MTSNHYLGTMIMGLTACYSNEALKVIFTYCEGDTVEIHCKNSDIFDAELKEHVDHYNEK